MVKSLRKKYQFQQAINSHTNVIKEAKQIGLAWAVLKYPRLGFAESLTFLHPKKNPVEGIHPTAVLGENVKLGEGVSIGANVCIGNKINK